jgi:hypothetical protein
MATPRLARRLPGTDSTFKRLPPPGFLPPTFDTALSRSQQQLSSDLRPASQRPETRSGAVICTDDLELTGPPDEDGPELDIVPLIDVLMYKAASKRWNDAVVNRISIDSMIQVKCPTACHVERDHIAGTSNGPQKAFASVRVATKPRL